jgi:hypothetical protein
MPKSIADAPNTIRPQHAVFMQQKLTDLRAGDTIGPADFLRAKLGLADLWSRGELAFLFFVTLFIDGKTEPRSL